MQTTNKQLKRNTRILLVFFMAALAFSGITAIPLLDETHWVYNILQTYTPGSAAAAWLGTVYKTLAEMTKYPFLSYGFDWLAFAHIIIAIAFIGPLMDPVRNKWVIYFGMIACGLIIPLALIGGHFRHIPFWWRLIDCSFGVIGIIPLCFILINIRKLEVIEQSSIAQLY